MAEIGRGGPWKTAPATYRGREAQTKTPVAIVSRPA
jgi:hypothetical protein